MDRRENAESVVGAIDTNEKILQKVGDEGKRKLKKWEENTEDEFKRMRRRKEKGARSKEKRRNRRKEKERCTRRDKHKSFMEETGRMAKGGAPYTKTKWRRRGSAPLRYARSLRASNSRAEASINGFSTPSLASARHI